MVATGGYGGYGGYSGYGDKNTQLAFGMNRDHASDPLLG